ncbi:MAG: hypothetical protein CYPHOPRED_000883 [Cyphobasidiales sp. Tagirdzhanova-0007]|nr:MAG: hypothetical protein CYPHOPRED_000883 [Cyphobasidiales sp. Tagirdzhanova-0007]
MKTAAASVAIAILSWSTAVAAQASSDSSPYIPESGISDSCHDFLVALDSNTQLASCSSALLSATSLFSPAVASSSSSSTNAQVSAALKNLCSSSSSCSDSLIKQSLTWFSGNCSAELAAGNELVTSNYDVFYVLSPFTAAVCTTDQASGSFCALEIGQTPAATANATSISNSTATTPSTQQLLVQSYEAPHIKMADLYVSLSDAAKSAISRLARRAFNHNGHSLKVRGANTTISTVSTSTTNSSKSELDSALLPNATTFRSSNLPFLFLSGSMTSAQLCTPCTQSIFAAYVSFESQFPYSQGLSKSPILGGQVDLWNDIGGVCGSGFLSAITAESGSTVLSGAGRSAIFSSTVTLVVAAVSAFLFL